MILALDTSGTVLVVALLDASLTVTGSRVVPGRRHQDVVMEMIQELLGEPSAASGLDAVAVVRGPGSQTGVRVGLSTAAGMAFGGDLKLLPLDSLAVAAARADRRGPVTAVASAGRANVFARAFSAEGEPTGSRVLCALGEVLTRVGLPAAPVCGEDALVALAAAAGLPVAAGLLAPEEALAVAVRRALNAGRLLAYHELIGDYGDP